MLLVSTAAVIGPMERERIDQMARQVVLGSYRQTGTVEIGVDAAFEAALAAYQKSFPSVPKAVARQAVLFIIESDRESPAQN